MLVLDASVVIELLASDDVEKVLRLENRIHEEFLVAPDHMWLEVAAVVSRMTRSGMFTDLQAQRIIAQLQRLNIRPIGAHSFIERIWKLRKNIYSLDAAYVAIAESLSAPLLTCDRRLSKSAGAKCRFELW